MTLCTTDSIPSICMLIYMQIEKGVRSLWYDMRDRLVAMRTANAFDDMDGLVSSLSQWQKSILVQVQNLQELDADWESNTTKVGICMGNPTEIAFTKISSFQHVWDIYVWYKKKFSVRWL